MENLFYNISQVLGITIIHSLWQGLLVWFVLHLLFTCAPSMSSVKKHNLGMAGIFTICAWFVYTFIVQIQQHVWVDLAAVTSPGLLPHFDFPLNAATHAIPAARLNYVIEGYLPYVSALYFAGLVFNLLRMSLNLQKLSLIKNSMIPADEVQIYVDNLCEKLRIHKYVSANFSRMVDVPCMIGFFKPIVLLPITLTTYLSATEIEAILLHELSHIKRNDYLLNMIQQLITVLLFFNPFAQLINKLINQERENRCDDLVVQTTAQPLIYAQALLKLEQTRHMDLHLVMAATGKKYHLLNRIERIMKTTKPIGNIRHLLVAVAIMAASISSIAWLNPTIKNGKLSIKKVAFPKVIAEPIIDTVHKSVIKSKKVVAYKKAKASQANHDKHVAEAYGLNDAELSRLTAEVTKHAEAMGKYYNSEEFKRQSELLQQKGKEMADYYNRPEIKELQERQQKIAAEYQKEVGDGSETKELSEKMHQAGEKMGKYFNSPEFKEMNEQLEKKYGIPHNHNYYNDSKDENYRKYQDELQSKIPPAVKQQTDEMKKMGEQMRAKYDSPEFHKKQDELRAMSDSMRKAYSNPQMKEQQAEMRKLSEQMKSFQNNPDLKKEKEQLNLASKRLHEYMNSPAYKKKMAEYHKQTYKFLQARDIGDEFARTYKPYTDSKPDTTNR